MSGTLYCNRECEGHVVIVSESMESCNDECYQNQLKTIISDFRTMVSRIIQNDTESYRTTRIDTE